MGRPFIVLGDGTSHGGTVVEASQVTFTHNKPIARVGDKVTCPIPGHGTTVIVEGDPTMILDGKPVARHGDKCACGAVLISSQVVSSIDSGGGSASRSSSPNATASAPSTATTAKSASASSQTDQ
ncbi:MAG: PAAR domain-containing protein, partial [Burkholderiales bacterium]|nr:PAAR domain-containing protein [Burkholderiales bacterium]